MYLCADMMGLEKGILFDACRRCKQMRKGFLGEACRKEEVNAGLNRLASVSGWLFGKIRVNGQEGEEDGQTVLTSILFPFPGPNHLLQAVRYLAHEWNIFWYC
jgi:hypothetical protein